MREVSEFGKYRKRTLAVIMVFAMAMTSGTPKTTVYAEEQSVTSAGISVQPEENPVITENVQPEETAVPTVEPTTTPQNTLVVKKKKCSYPKKIYEGQTFTLKGTLKANHKIQKVQASIKDEQGKDAMAIKKKANSNKFDLKKIDDDMHFSKLEAGKYTYEIKVSDSYGNERVALQKDFKVKETTWAWPVDGGSKGDGFHCGCSVHGGRHLGVDIKGVSKGTSIKAIADGTVVYAKYHQAARRSSFGKLVIVYHGNGIYSYYAHCNTIRCKVGDKVEKGDVISTMGETGAAYGTHLHLELRKGPAFSGNYNSYDFLDKYTYKQFNPMKYLTKR